MERFNNLYFWDGRLPLSPTREEDDNEDGAHSKDRTYHWAGDPGLIQGLRSGRWDYGRGGVSGRVCVCRGGGGSF
jgi:hypothetical protein